MTQFRAVEIANIEAHRAKRLRFWLTSWPPLLRRAIRLALPRESHRSNSHLAGARRQGRDRRMRIPLSVDLLPPRDAAPARGCRGFRRRQALPSVLPRTGDPAEPGGPCLDGRFEILFAAPNRQAIGIFKKVGYTYVGRAEGWLRVLRSQFLVRKFIKSEVLSRAAAPVVDGAIHLMLFAQYSPEYGAFEGGIDGKCPEALDDVWRRERAPYAFKPDKSAAVLGCFCSIDCSYVDDGTDRHSCYCLYGKKARQLRMMFFTEESPPGTFLSSARGNPSSCSWRELSLAIRPPGVGVIVSRTRPRPVLLRSPADTGIDGGTAQEARRPATRAASEARPVGAGLPHFGLDKLSPPEFSLHSKPVASGAARGQGQVTRTHAGRRGRFAQPQVVRPEWRVRPPTRSVSLSARHPWRTA